MLRVILETIIPANLLTVANNHRYYRSADPTSYNRE